MSTQAVLALDFGTVNTYFCKCPADQVTPVGVDFGGNKDGIATAILYRKNTTALIGDAALEEYGEATHDEKKDYLLRTQFKPDISRSADARQDAIAFLQGVLAESDQQNLTLRPSERDVIIGVPSESDEAFRQALTAIAAQAGYGEIRTVDEPKGALLYHVSHKDIPSADALKGVLVVDFGGGTCDFAFMHRGMVRYSWGEMDLGGRLFDDLFFQWFLDENPGAYPQMVDNGDEFFVAWKICREMKEKFSQTMTRSRSDTFKKAVGEYGRLTGATWDEFVSRASRYRPSDTFRKYLSEAGPKIGRLADRDSPIDLFEWLRSSLRKGLDENNIEPTDISFVIQAGGSSLWPFVTEIIESELHLQPSHLMRSDRPYVVVAEGLAMLPALQDRFAAAQKALRKELPDFTRLQLRPLISQRIEAMAGLIADEIAFELYDGQLRPVLTKLRTEGGSVASLEHQLASTVSAFRPRAEELVQDKVSRMSSGLHSDIRQCVKEWFARHDLAPPAKSVFVTAQAVPFEPPDVSKGMFRNITGLMAGLASSIVAMICGGGGMALIATGPVGWVIGLILGLAVALAGAQAAKKVKLPAFALKFVLSDAKLSAARKKLTKNIVAQVTQISATFNDPLEDQIKDLVSTEIESLSEINQM